MPDPGTIAAFILARIGEEEEATRAAIAAGRPGSAGFWKYDRTRELLGTTSEIMDGYMVVADRSDVPMDARIGVYIAGQNPAATLARCAALRDIVRQAEASAQMRREVGNLGEHGDDLEQVAQSGANAWRGAMLRVAKIYRLRPDGSQHPEWRKEWEEA